MFLFALSLHCAIGEVVEVFVSTVEDLHVEVDTEWGDGSHNKKVDGNADIEEVVDAGPDQDFPK